MRIYLLADVVHLTCQGVEGPEMDFKTHIESLFETFNSGESLSVNKNI